MSEKMNANFDNIIIRDLKQKDIAALSHVHVNAYLKVADIKGTLKPTDTYENHRPANIKRWKDDFAAVAKKGAPENIKGAFSNDKMLGFVWYGACKDEAQSGKVHALYVHPDNWGEGIGKELLRTAARDLKKNDFEKMSLWTDSSFPFAMAFYKSAGGLAGQQKYSEEFCTRWVKFTFPLTGNTKLLETPENDHPAMHSHEKILPAI